MRTRFSAAVAAFVAAVASASAASAAFGADTPRSDGTSVDQSATITFLRPSHFGGAVTASVFDVTDGGMVFVGTVAAGKGIAYAAHPGTHRFMVVGETADFLDARMVSGHTYYAKVQPEVGMLKTRFSLEPETVNSPDLATDLNDCELVGTTASSREWAKGQVAAFEAKKAEFLPLWIAKPPAERAVLADERGH